MKMWIAREEGGMLYLHWDKPTLKYGLWCSRNYIWVDEEKDGFPEVVFENSPMEVELKLDDGLKLAHQISNKELREILSQYPDDAMVAVEYCNIRELRYHKDRNLITID